MTVLVAILAFACMEPLAALAHRAVMHGRGWAWHRSHHRPLHTGWERNDVFPLVLAGLTVSVMAYGAVSHAPLVVASGIGVTAYGVAYAVAHDLCTHGRLSKGVPLSRGRCLRWLAGRHAVHHSTGGAPYGFLVPIVPAKQRVAVAAFRSDDTRARRENTS